MYLSEETQTYHILPFVIGVGLLSWITYVLGIAVYNVTFHPLAKYPGPKLRAAFWWPDTWVAFHGNRVRDVYALHQRYGSVVRTAPNVLSFTDGRVWKDVYGFRPGKGQMAKDPGSLNIDETDGLPRHIINHARYRRALAHAFSDHALREQEPILNTYFDLFTQRLDQETGNTIDFVGLYNYATFDIIGDLTLADSFHMLERGGYHPWTVNILGAIKFSRWLRLGRRYPVTKPWLRAVIRLFPRFREARRTHLRYTEERVNARLENDTDRKDFMHYILRQTEGKGMSQKEMVANASVLLIAGSETTATLLAGATYLLLQHPATLQRLTAEVRGAFRASDDLTLAATSRLPYLHAVIEEALRLYPPVPDMLPRVVPPGGAEVAGRWVPEGTVLGVHQWSTYRDAANFTEPNAFAPERWLPSPPSKFAGDHRDAMQAFSFGPRNCLGKNLAYNEMRSLLARVVYNFDLELCPESHNWMDQKAYLLWQKKPLYVRLSAREKKE